MGSLANFLVENILNEDVKPITALFGGGFKPPTAGHLEVVKKAINDNPEIDKIIIYVGGKVRNGVTQDQAIEIWDKFYKPQINKPVEILPSIAPIKDIYRYAKNNPEETVYWVIGAREGREDDLKDIANRSISIDKYPNLQLKTTSTPDGGMSGTNARKAIVNNNFEEFERYLPDTVDKNAIWDILTKQELKKENIDPKAQAKHKGKAAPFGSAYEKVDETGLKIAKKNMDDYKRSNNPSGKKPKDPFGLNQFARELMKEEDSFDTFDYPKHLKLYTQYMLDQGMDIRPLPKVKFINDDVENAKEFLGKTAYYDPANRLIVLYTLNRHPKDVMRSFSHEMIHHLQNNQNRLGNVSTTNTNQDDHVDNLEKEANLLGTMTFRHWTDTLTEGILKEGRYDKISNEISSNIFNYWKKDFEAGKKASRYFENEENEDLEIDIDANITFLPNSEQLTIDGGAEESHSEDDSAYLKVRFEVDPKMLPEFWEEISMNLKDVVRHEIEHMTQAGTFSAGGYKKVYKKVDGKWEETDEYEWQGKDFKDDQIFRKMIDMELLPKAEYFKLAKEVDANLQGMYFRAKKEKRPFGDIINNYLDAQDITAKEKEEILDLWRNRNKALNLPQF